MVSISTKAFGTVEIRSDEVIHFSDGILGFENYHDFVLIGENEESPFQWLQSMEEETLAFIVIEPSIFLKENYKPEILNGDLKALNVTSVDSCDIYLIVTIPENQPEKMTANLQGPILLNTEKKIGRQVISLNDKHVVRVPILEQMEG